MRGLYRSVVDVTSGLLLLGAGLAINIYLPWSDWTTAVGGMLSVFVGLIAGFMLVQPIQRLFGVMRLPAPRHDTAALSQAPSGTRFVPPTAPVRTALTRSYAAQTQTPPASAERFEY